MKIGHKIDASGFLTVDVLSDSEEKPDVTVICPDGFYKPKWNGSAWVEGLTAQEIEDIVNRPIPKTPEQKKFDKLAVDNEQLNLQVIDLFEQLIFKGVL